MSIELPNLQDTSSCRLIACGAIQTTKQELLGWLSTPRTMIAAYSKGRVRHFARLMTGGNKPKHFHLEVALSSWFPTNMKPDANDKLAAIQKAVEHVSGEKIELNMLSEFRVPISSLAQTGPIRLLSTETSVGGTTIQLTAGTVSVTGSRIREISWERLTEKEVSISLRAQMNSVVAAKYLLDAGDLMGRLFKVLVLGQPATETR
jgi:hypothetical protein